MSKDLFKLQCQWTALTKGTTNSRDVVGREIKTEQRLTCELCLFAEVAGVTVLHVGKSRSREGGGRAVLVPMDGFADVIRS